MKREVFKPRRGALAIAPSAIGEAFDVDTARGTSARESIAIVTVRGPLMHHDEGCFDSYDAIKSRVLEALAIRPRFLILSIDSPGGLVSGCFDTSREIRAACDAAGVEVHTYVDGLSASAGYALAAIGESVTIPEAGVAGSIGVIETIVDESAALAAAGVSVELIASGARKTDGNPTTAISEPARIAIRARVEELADVFAAHVARYRPLSAEQVRAQEAALYTGASAVRAGLADRVGSLDDLIAILASGTSPAPLAQTGGQMTDEEKARAALAAIVEDEKADEKAKARAKAALAAMDEEPDGDEEKPKAEHDEPDGDEPEATAPAGASLAKTSQSLEARVMQLEAEAEHARKIKILDGRPDILPETRKALMASPVALMASIVKTIPRREVKPAASATVPATRGDTQTGEPAPSSDAAAMDLAMGRGSVASNGVRISADRRSITLGADIVTTPKKGA